MSGRHLRVIALNPHRQRAIKSWSSHQDRRGESQFIKDREDIVSESLVIIASPWICRRAI